jgi:hypothetical protein
MIKPGTYRAKATEGALGLTKGGKEQAAIAFAIIDGEHAGESVTWFGYFTDATAERTIESLRTCGWIGDDLSDLTGILDNEVQIVIEHEDYEGKTQVRVKWVNRSGSGGLALKERLEGGAAKAFAQRMKGIVLAQKAKGGGATQQRPARNGTSSRGSASADPLAGADFGDDDIGF